MTREAANEDWQDTQNEDYVALLRSRLRQPPLLWVKQFAQIIDQQICAAPGRYPATVRINDYGCNVGHFFRVLGDIRCVAHYRGFDISPTYLAVAQETFGSEHFHRLDVTASNLDVHLLECDVAVMSATLEHLQAYEQALRNIFTHAKRLVVIRTFVGDTSLQDRCTTVGAKTDYLIRQFELDELTRIPRALGWQHRQEIDLATQGKSKFVCNGTSIARTQSVLVFEKNEA